MGIKRSLWRGTGVGRITDTVKNSVKEKSIVKGLQKTYIEDMEDGKSMFEAIGNACDSVVKPEFATCKT